MLNNERHVNPNTYVPQLALEIGAFSTNLSLSLSPYPYFMYVLSLLMAVAMAIYSPYFALISSPELLKRSLLPITI